MLSPRRHGRVSDTVINIAAAAFLGGLLAFAAMMCVAGTPHGHTVAIIGAAGYATWSTLGLATLAILGPPTWFGPR